MMLISKDVHVALAGHDVGAQAMQVARPTLGVVFLDVLGHELTSPA